MFIGRVFAVANAEFLIIGFSKTWIVEVNDAKDNYIEDSLDSKLSVSRQMGQLGHHCTLFSCVCMFGMLLFPVGTMELWHMSIGSVGTIFVTLYVSKSAYSNYSQPAATFKCCGNKEMIVYGIC